MNREDKINVTVQLAPQLLKQIDARARDMDLNRSQYFRLLVRQAMSAEAEKFEDKKAKVAA